MATLTNTNPTLLDWKMAHDSKGNIAALIDLMAQTNQILQDMTFIEGNEITGHMMSVLTGLPKTTWRKLYQRIQPDKARREQIREVAAWQEAYNEIDYQLYLLNGSGPEFRMQEASAQIEAMGQELARKVFAGNGIEHPEEIMGLMNRYNSLSAENGRRNIINAGGSGSDNRSIWLICWGPAAIFGFTPKGLPSGLQMTDLGRVTSENTDGKMEVLRTHFKWDVGLGVADWRYAVRIANIDKSDLSPDYSTGANLPDLMSRATRRIPQIGGSSVRKAWYMESDMIGFIEQQLAHAIRSSTLQVKDVGGVMTEMFRGIPIRQVDQLDMDESRVT